jgi:hypothetical protein
MQFFTEERELLVSECTRGQGNFPGLLLKGLQNLRVTVSLIHSGIRCQAIEVTFALNVIDPDAFRALDHNVERTIMMSPIPVLQFDEVLGVRGLL